MLATKWLNTDGSCCLIEDIEKWPDVPSHFHYLLPLQLLIKQDVVI